MPESIDCIRALLEMERDASRSIAKTNRALGITKTFLPKTTQPIPHLTGADVEHPEIEAVRAAHAEFRSVGFKGAEEPAEAEPAAARR